MFYPQAVRRAESGGRELGVLVEVNVGFNRCGVDTPQEAADLAERACNVPGETPRYQASPLGTRRAPLIPDEAPGPW